MADAMTTLRVKGSIAPDGKDVQSVVYDVDLEVSLPLRDVFAAFALAGLVSCGFKPDEIAPHRTKRMSVIKNTVFGELIVAITDEAGGEVEIALAGLEEKYSVYISTRAHAIKSLREIADWLEKQE